MKCGAHSSVIDPHFALPMENACSSHTRTAWILYFPHLYVLLFILQYLLEDMREELNSEFLCILQQKSASHGTSFFLWYISLCDHIYMWAKFFFFLFCPLFFFFWLKEAVEVNNVFIVQQKGKVRHVVVIDIIWKHLESVRLPNHPDQIKKRWTQDYINKLSKAHPTSFTCESAFWPEKIELQLNTDG